MTIQFLWFQKTILAMTEEIKNIMSKKMSDQFEKLPCGSLIQHGPYSDRIYLMKLSADAPKSLPSDLIAMARQRGYSKVFVKVAANNSKSFTQAEYIEEASIPEFYNGSDAGIFMAYYLSESRATEADAETLDKNLKIALGKAGSSISALDTEKFTLRCCEEKDVEEMAAIYRAVFPTYPFPIHDPAYLLETMQSHIDYFGVEKDGKLIALSSAEMDKLSSNVEMTDFATLPQWRGNSLSIHLLLQMEEDMKLKGMKTAYTIARAMSPGMNVTFSKLGYTYGGRLKNNTNISGNIESMNIWYKPLA